MSEFVIRPVAPSDLPVLVRLIGELAAYEHSEATLEVTPESLAPSLFGQQACAEAMLGFLDGHPVAYAIVMPILSSYRGRPLLYLEDVYVREDARGAGLGRRMMAHVARLAVERGCPSLHWSVLDWNHPAIDFYLRLGAEREEGRSHYSLAGDALRDLAHQ